MSESSKVIEGVFDGISFDIDSDGKDDILDWVGSPEFNEMILNKGKAPNIPDMLKIFNIASELYISNPKLFRVAFNQMANKIKLNTKIWKTYKTKEEVGGVYGAINFFDKMVKEKQGYDHAYKESSKFYKIPEKYLRSIIGTRNALKRNKLKI